LNRPIERANGGYMRRLIVVLLAAAGCQSPVEKMGFVELDTPLSDKEGKVLLATEFADGERFRYQDIYGRGSPVCLASYKTNELVRDFGFEASGEGPAEGIVLEGKVKAGVKAKWVLQELVHCGADRFKVSSVSDFEFDSGASTLGEMRIVVGLLCAKKYHFEGDILAGGTLEVKPAEGTGKAKGEVEFKESRKRDGEDLVVGIKVDRLRLRRVAKAEARLDAKTPSASPRSGSIGFVTLRMEAGELTLESLRLDKATLHRSGAEPEKVKGNTVKFAPPPSGGFYLVDMDGEDFEYARLDPIPGGWSVRLARYRFERESE
jgi:hypothetical protein